MRSSAYMDITSVKESEYSLGWRPLTWMLTLITLLSVGCVGFTGEVYWLVIPIGVAVMLLPFRSLKWFYGFFLFTVPLSAEIQINPNLAITLPDEPLMGAFLLLTMFYLIRFRHTFPKWFWNNSLTFIIILQLFWLIVSVVFAYDHIPALKFLLAKLWYLAAYLFIPTLLIRDKKDFAAVALILCIPIVLHAMFVFAWHATLKFGYWESNIVVEPFYKNHVDYGSVLSMIFPAVYVFWRLKKANRTLWWIGLFVLLFLCAAIYVAFSRAAILATMFAFVIMIAIRKKWVNLLMPSFYAFIILIISFLAIDNRYIDFRPNKSKNATQETFIETVTGAFTGKDMSSMERFYRWIASVRMVKENPITGVGPNNWYNHYKSHTVYSFSTWVSRNPERSTTHNYFLLMVTEQGIPAMILYAVLIVMLFAKGQKIYHRFQDPTYKWITLAATMSLGAGFVNNFFSEVIETHKVGGLFYISIALLIVLDAISKREIKTDQQEAMPHLSEG